MWLGFELPSKSVGGADIGVLAVADKGVLAVAAVADASEAALPIPPPLREGGFVEAVAAAARAPASVHVAAAS